MCRPASFVLTKDRVFWSKKSDSHEDIIEEFELHSDGVRGPNIVRVEVTHRDMRTPLSEWKFEVVQDELPPWHDPDVDESRARTALIEWAAHKLVIDRACEVIDGQVYAYGISRVTAYGSSAVYAYGSSTVKAYGIGTVKACENDATVSYCSCTEPVRDCD